MNPFRPTAAVVSLLAAAVLLTGCQVSDSRAQDPAASESAPAVEPEAQVEFGLVIHGGAGTILRENMTDEQEAEYRARLEASLRAGLEVLDDGGEALDAVTAAIRVMEDSPLFNAGKGAVFTHEGTTSLDAALMDGARRRAGAVAGVDDVRNPIDLARHVMDDSPHVMLSGDGAETFAREMGIPSTPADYFFTERRWESLQEALEEEGAPTPERPDGVTGGETAAAVPANVPARARKYGTVGAVALDREGRIAAGTSTGGMTNKRWGRIGDVPVIGAGTYAEEDCGVSTTGWGEFFIRNVVAYDICARMRYTEASLAESAHAVIFDVLETQEPETGGAIAMDARGHITWPFNSRGMYRGLIDQDGNVTVEIFRQD